MAKKRPQRPDAANRNRKPNLRERPRVIDLRAAESITGEFIKNQEIKLKRLSDFNLDSEEALRRMSYYDFNFHIFALKQHSDEQNEQNQK